MKEATVVEGTVTLEMEMAVADISSITPSTSKTGIKKIGWPHKGGTAMSV